MNAIIVDDENDACQNLATTLTRYIDSKVNIVGIAHSTTRAEELIKQLKPDLIFLDIEMPRENAFSFLERIAPVTFEIIFVTAFDKYAIKAFRLNAADYILKPICIEEVAEAVKKVEARISHKRSSSADSNASSVINLVATHIKANTIRIKNNVGFEIVEFADIIFLEAQGSYTMICYKDDSIGEKQVVMSNSLNEYEELLSPDIFYRIHRSYLINCTHVKKILNDDNVFVIMKNKMRLPVSRRRVPNLMSVFKNNNSSL